MLLSFGLVIHPKCLHLRSERMYWAASQLIATFTPCRAGYPRQGERKLSINYQGPTWRELSDNIMPRRGNFLGVAHRGDRGGKHNAKLLDSNAMPAARTLASRLIAGLISPARPLSGIHSKRIRCAPMSIAEIDRPNCMENSE